MSETSLLEALKAATESPSTKLPQDRAAKEELLTELRKLNAELKSPEDAIMRYVFQPHQNAMIRTAIDLKLFERVGGREENGTSAEELAELTGAEQALIVRVMRVLVTMGIFSEFGEQRYAATPISQKWRAPSLRDCAKHLFDEAAFSLAHLPAFLERTHYKNPSDTARGPFQYAFQTDGGLWEFLKKNPQRMSAFNTFMEGQGIDRNRIQWYERFPVQEVLLDSFKTEEKAVLLVDIGGGRGHDVEAFKEAFPHQEGRLIVQDLPEVIDEIKRHVPGVEVMEHNFFEPQPVKGAKVYYFHSIFHDWPEQQCHEILQQTAAAMTKGYSRLLINEWVLAPQGGPMHSANMDINMMCLCASGERSEKQWNELLHSAGLKIVRIHNVGPEMESLIEVMLE